MYAYGRLALLFLSCPKSYKPVLFTAHHKFLILLCWSGEARSSLSLTRTSASIPPALEAKTMEESWLWCFRRICWEEREPRIAEMMWIYHDRNQFQTRVYGSCSTSRKVIRFHLLALNYLKWSLYVNHQFYCLGGPRDKALIALSSAPIHSPRSFSVCNHYLRFVSPRPREQLRKERAKRSMPSRSLECTEMTETPLDLHRNTNSISAQIGRDGHSQRRKKSCSSFTNVGHLPWARC